MFDKFLHKTLRLPYHLYIASDRRAKNETATIVFLHGIAASSAAWKKTMEEFVSNRIADKTRLIAIDLFGYGKSPAPIWSEYKTDDYLKSFHRTLRSLHIKTPIILVGHSMGSLLAVEYASMYPKDDIAALALLSPPFLRSVESKALLDRLYRKVYDKLLTADQIKQVDIIASWFEKHTSFEPNEATKKSFELSMKHVIIGSCAYEKIKNLCLPIHIFHGSVDVLVNGTNLMHLSKQENISIYTSRVGHDITESKRKQLAETIRKLLKTL